MKYAIVHKKSAESAGIDVRYSMHSADKTKVILNENELRIKGDPEAVAKKLGGTLVNRSQLNNLMNSEIWQNK